MIKHLIFSFLCLSLVANSTLVWAQDDDEDFPEDPVSAADLTRDAALTRLEELVSLKLNCENAPTLEKYEQGVRGILKKTIKANQPAAKYNGLSLKELGQELESRTVDIVASCKCEREGCETDDPEGEDDFFDEAH